MLKKVISYLLALILMAGMSVSTVLAEEKANETPGQNAQSEAQPRELLHVYESGVAAARAEVPPDAVFMGLKDDKDTVLFEFFDNNTLRSYEAVVLKSVNMVQEVKIGGSNNPGSATVTKTSQDIEAIVLQEYPDAKNIEITLKKEGNLSHYEAAFSTAKFSKAQVKLNPVTGAIGSQKLQYKVDPSQAKEDVTSDNIPQQPKEEQPSEKDKQSQLASTDWKCAKCGTVNHEGKFCTNCGTQRPSYACGKCGWQPKDPAKLPKFCPECGARFQTKTVKKDIFGRVKK